MDSLPTFLALDLACVAAYQKLIHLESWLRERMNDGFATQCLDFLGQKIVLETAGRDNENSPVSLSLDSMSTFLKVLGQR